MRSLFAFLTALCLCLFLAVSLYAADNASGNNLSEALNPAGGSGENQGTVKDCPNTPPTAECPDITDFLLCESGEVEIPGFVAGDLEDDIASITSSLGYYQDGSVFFTPAEPGEYEIIFTVTDGGGLTASCTTYVNIGINSAPVCEMPELTSIIQCTPTQVCLPVSVSDADGNLEGCEVISGPGTVVDGNWCYTPEGDEIVDVTIECTDLCGESCQTVFQVQFALQEHWAVITIDRTGSMSLLSTFGESRLNRAKEQAHLEIDKLLDMEDADYPGIYTIAIFYFNSSEGVVLASDFTSDSEALHTAIDDIPGPKHDTPLAAAMCQSHCEMPILDGQCVRYVITFTDGLENASQEEDICELCVDCNQFMENGWNYDCNPSNPSSCTQWQLCLADKFAQSGINLMHYFGSPINPFDKSGSADGLEDLYFLKYTAEESQGQFVYHTDQNEVCADANSDGVVNISDAIFIINYIFSQGPEPDPYVAGDANWDGGVNVSDATRIIMYVFLGGSAPGCALQ